MILERLEVPQLRWTSGVRVVLSEYTKPLIFPPCVLLIPPLAIERPIRPAEIELTHETKHVAPELKFSITEETWGKAWLEGMML